MKKFLSLLVVLCMIFSLVPSTFVSAASSVTISDLKLIDYPSTDEIEDVYSDPTFTSYMPATDSGGKYMLYMEDAYTKLPYNFSNFLANGASEAGYSAIAWPPTLKTRTSGDGYPAQNATISTSENTITSTKSNITYKLPDRVAPTADDVASGTTFSIQEVASVDFSPVHNFGVPTKRSTTVNINGSFQKIHFLIGVAGTTADKSGALSVSVEYDDGIKTDPAGTTWNTYGSDLRATFPADLLDTEEADGRNGYLFTSLPLATADAQNARKDDNFVADFESYFCQQPYAINQNSFVYDGSFSKSANSVVAYEYSIDVDPEKTVSKLIFTHQGSVGRTGYAVLGVVGTDYEETGIKSQIKATNTAIDNLIAAGTDATMEQIESTTAMISEMQDAGYGQYINVNQLNGFFSNTERELFVVEKDNEFKVRFTANNTSSTRADMFLISALYDENGQLVDAIETDVQIPANTDKMVISKSVTLPDVDFSYARFLVWDKNIQPYADRVYYTDNEVYTPVNLTDFADGKFYVSSEYQPNTSDLTQNPTELKLATYMNDMNYNGDYDFPTYTGSSGKAAAYYPVYEIDYNTREVKESPLNSDDGFLHSKKTGVKYALPEKREGVHNKEAIALSYVYKKSATVDLDNNIYSNIHFLVASANYLETKIIVKINYADGSQDIDCVDTYKLSGTDKENFVTTISHVPAVNGGEFGEELAVKAIRLSLFEYSVKVNQPKVVDSITFEAYDSNLLTPVPSVSVGNLMITSITTEKKTSNEIKQYLNNKMSSSYINQEAESLRDIVEFLEQQGVDCSEFSSIPTGSSSARQVYVSATADSSSADGKYESPYATIEEALDYINSASDSYIGNWEVILRGGTYELSQSINIDETVLPSLSSVTFKPYQDEVVEFTGAKTIDMTKATTPSTDIQNRLPSASKSSVVQVDLTAQNITGISPYTTTTYNQDRTPASRVIIDDVAYNAARWPNQGSIATIGSVVNSSSDGSGMEFTVSTSTSTSNIANWNTAEDAIIHGFFANNDYQSDSFTFAETSQLSYYPYTKTVKTGSTMNGDTAIQLSTRTKRLFFIENLLEEIDVPGEWYIDYTNNILYLYPVANSSSVRVSTLTDNLFNISNVNNITFEDIIFNGGVGGAVKFNNADNCQIKNCQIKNFTGTAVELLNCSNSGIQSSDMLNLGSCAVNIKESDYKTKMECGNNYVTDCKIENICFYSRLGVSVISAQYTNGTRITNNKISNAPAGAIKLGEPINNIIQYNDISNVQQEYGDAGVIYSGQRFISQGNIISNNFIHDVTNYSAINTSIYGIYIDDMSCGFDINNNVIANIDSGMLLGGGKDLNAQNNIIYAIENSMITDVRGLTKVSDEGSNQYRTRLVSHIKKYPLYRMSFPHTMDEYYTDTDYYKNPVNNTVTNNFFYGTDQKYVDTAETVWNDATLNNTNTGNAYVSESNAPIGIFEDANGNFKVDSSDMEYILTQLPNFKDVNFSQMGLTTER